MNEIKYENMKTQTFKKIFFLTALLFINCSNSDPKDQLPPITQTGENTFGCLIDGEVFVPKGWKISIYGYDFPVTFWGSHDDNYNGITVRDFESNDAKRMDINLYHLEQNGTGTFTVDQSNCLDIGYANPSINIRCRYNGAWYCSTENSGTLSITRYDNNIVSGTFSCTVINRDDPTDRIEITKGRFDFYRPSINTTQFP